MNFIGKILGGFFGLLVLGPLGAIIGIFIGHYFDKGLTFNRMPPGTHRSSQHSFFDNTFAVMGYVAKADGRVSASEIDLARLMMQQLGLHGERRHQAMRQFNKGKQTDFRLEQALDDLRRHCTYSHLLRLFIELQVQMAYADGTPSENVKSSLQHISQQLDLGRIDFSHIETMFYGQWHQQRYQRQAYQYQPPSSVSAAYKLLGINENATIGEIKKAYRRKMNENHPDKMIAKGLPKEMIELATEKTQQIKAAFQQIRKARRF